MRGGDLIPACFKNPGGIARFVGIGLLVAAPVVVVLVVGAGREVGRAVQIGVPAAMFGTAVVIWARHFVTRRDVPTMLRVGVFGWLATTFVVAAVLAATWGRDDSAKSRGVAIGVIAALASLAVWGVPIAVARRRTRRGDPGRHQVP